MKKSERSPGKYETPSRRPTYTLWEPQKSEKGGAENIFEEIMAENFLT